MKSLLKRKRFWGIILSTVVVVMLISVDSCSNLIQIEEQPQEGKASLIVMVPGHRAASDNIKSYTVDVNGASGNVATAKVEVGGTASFADMAPGEYTVVVQGYDSNGTVIFKGENKATVVAGESTSVVIELKGTSFNVTLYSNIDSADPVTQTINYGDKLPQDIFTKRDGYTLAGWTEKQDGSGTVYDANTPVIFTEDKTLYAQWSVTSFTALQTEVGKDGTVSVSGSIDVPTGLTISKNVTLVAASGGATLTNETATPSPLFTVNSGTLTLGDGINSLTLDGNAKTAYGVKVESGEVIMKDKVTIQKAGDSGIRLNGGTFNMEGGTIRENTASTDGGGGVFVFDGDFNMNGGTITENKVSTNGSGKGVYVSTSGSNHPTFTMSGDAVVDSSNDVYLNGDAVITVSGELTGTTVATITPATYTAGTNVLTDGSNVSLVSSEASKFAVTPDEANSTNYTINTDGQLVLLATNGTELTNALAIGGTIYVRGEISVTTGLKVSKTVTLVGVGEEATIINASKAKLFTVSSGTLTLGDGINSLTLNGGKVQDAYGIEVSSGGELVMKDKVTIRNAAKSGVRLAGGTFTMDGGSITENTSVQPGAGVSIGDGTFTMNGGSITKNQSLHSATGGGGVYLVSGTFTMKGGIISGNTATSNGGGVYVYVDGTFDMTGGEISGNTADKGAEVYISAYTNGDSKGTFKMGGSATLKGGDVYLYNNGASVPITLTSSLTSGSTDNPVAKITLEKWDYGVAQVLTDGSNGSLLSSEVSKFILTYDGTINDSGVLEKVI